MKRILELAKDYWQALALAVAGVTTLLTLDSLVNWIRQHGATDLEPSDGRMLLSETWGWTIAILFILCLSSAAYTAVLAVQRNRLASIITRKVEYYAKTLTGMMLAATKIANRLYPIATIPPFSIDAIQITTIVREDGSSTVKASYRIKADQSAVHFWEVIIGAEPVATGVEFLDEIDFKIRDKDGADRVAYLVTRNGSHRKEMSVYFLPHLSPGEPAREIIYTYDSPQMVKKLLDEGNEEFTLTVKSRTPVDQIDYAMYFHPNLRRIRRLSCEVVNSAAGTGTLTEENSQDLGWHGWRYRVSNAPAQGFAYKLLFKAAKK